jgi:hypothetical protein
MVNGGGNLNTKPFCELLVLNAEILNSLLLFDLFEKFSKTIAFNNIATESTSSQPCPRRPVA